VIAPALGLHWSTDPLSGETAAIAGLVVAGMFSAGVVHFLKASPWGCGIGWTSDIRRLIQMQ
jgi:hypothetical protein